MVCGGDGEAQERMVLMDYEKTFKPKGCFIGADYSVPFERRLYSYLFSVADPSWLKEDCREFVSK